MIYSGGDFYGFIIVSKPQNYEMTILAEFALALLLV